MKKLIIPKTARIAWNTIDDTTVQRDDQESIFLATFDDVPTDYRAKYQIDYSYYNRGKYEAAPKFVLHVYTCGVDFENYSDTINHFDKEYDTLDGGVEDINHWLSFFKDHKRIIMTVIDALKQDYDDYLTHCLDVLDTKTDILDLDFTHGETDVIRLVFIEKKDLTKHHALAILTMRLLMFTEEWKDFKNYTKEDFERWIGFLEYRYTGSVYVPNVEIDDFKNNFFVQRLTTKKGLKSVKHNAQLIDFLSFKRLNPLFHEPIKAVSKSQFSSLKEEFYVETSHHFVLFHWFTTA
jgi:hypothetical protein